MTGTMPKASLFYVIVLVRLRDSFVVCIVRGYFGFVCVPILHVCYTRLWLKCVGIFQWIVNSISVSKSAVGIHVLENLYTTTTFRLHFIV